MKIKVNDSWVKIKCFDDIIPLVNEHYKKELSVYIDVDDEHKSEGYYMLIKSLKNMGGEVDIDDVCAFLDEWLGLPGKSF